MAERCRWCGQPVMAGNSSPGSCMSKAVHTQTGEEPGPDGLDPVPPDWAVA